MKWIILGDTELCNELTVKLKREGEPVEHLTKWANQPEQLSRCYGIREDSFVVVDLDNIDLAGPLTQLIELSDEFPQVDILILTSKSDRKKIISALNIGSVLVKRELTVNQFYDAVIREEPSS
jgi:DNA-binding response OmpR family regulator